MDIDLPMRFVVSSIRLRHNEYNGLGQLIRVTEGGAQVAAYTYDDNGNRATLTNSNGTTASYTYNKANLVTSLVNKKGTVTLSSDTYTYQLDGNQTGKTDHKGKTTSYTYDCLGRLTAENESGGNKITYAYDQGGNRVSMAVTGGENYTVTYTYDKNNRLLQDEKVEGETNEFCYYRYDANGNQLQREREKYSPIGTAAKKSAGFHEDLAAFEKREYNGLNQLVYVFAGNVRTDYAYRPDGLRHSKEVGGVLTTHLWDGQNMAAEAHANGIFARYIRGVNLIARRQDNLNQYYHFNAHGDVVLRTDQSGTALKSYEYDAFGVEKNPEKLDANPWRYCGEYYDKELEEYYLRNRYYNPRLGRFNAEDPIRDGGNWYSYCAGNPVAFVDPLGLKCYIFYGAEQEQDVEVYERQLKEIYGEDADVISISIKDGNTFMKQWEEQLGTDSNIQGVVITTHSSPESMAADNGNSIKPKHIEKLPKYTMDFIYLGSCNTGHYDGKDKNIAHAFANSQNSRYGVIAPDGYHMGLGGENRRETMGITTGAGAQKKFYNYRDENNPGSRRKSYGFVHYYKHNDKVIATPLLPSLDKPDKDSYSTTFKELYGFARRTTKAIRNSSK